MKIKSKIISLFFLLLFICTPLCTFVSAETAYAAISVSSSNVNVGDTITITAIYTASTVRGVEARLTYDNSILEYQNDNSDASGNAGVIKICSYTSNASSTMKIPLKFKALKVGTSRIVLQSDSVYTQGLSDLGTPSAGTTITVKNPSTSLSSDANLQNLTPSAGSLSPGFSPSTTDYTVNVPYETTSITFNALAEDSGAKVSKSGSNSLSVGSNKITFTVVAPNGNQKTYIVNVVRSKKSGSSSSDSSNGGAGSSGSTTNAASTTETAADATATTAAADPTEEYPIVIDGVRYKPVTDLTGIDSPGDCFTLTSCTMNGTDIPAYKHNNADITLAYLMSEEGQGSYFIYHTDDNTFSAFIPILLGSKEYVVMTEPADTNFENYVKTTVPIENYNVDAWNVLSTGGEQSDFYLIYAVNPDGNEQWYVYDAKENTMQRYFKDAVQAVNAVPSNDQQNEIASLQNFKKVSIIVIVVLSILVAGLAVFLVVSKIRDTSARHLNRW